MFLRRTAFSLHPQIRGSGVTIGITIAHTTYYVVEERKTLISLVEQVVEKTLKYIVFSNERYRVLYM